MNHDKKPIVFVLGLPGQLYLARAFAQEFKRPVVGLVNWSRLDEKMTPEWRSVFSNIYSLPDFYLEQLPEIKKLPRAELDRQQAELEEKLGIVSSAPIACYDRGLRWAGDYMKVRRYQLATLKFVDRFFAETEPAFLLDGVVTYLQNILRAACHKKNIPYLLTGHARTFEDVCLTHENGQQVGMLESLSALQENHAAIIPASTMQEADKFFDEFINRPATPAYEKKNSVLGFDIKRFITKLSWVLRGENMQVSEKVLLTDRAFGYEAHPFSSLYSGARAKFRIFLQNKFKVFDHSPDMEEPFFYLPLHHTPEISDLFFGSPYDHHAGFVAQLAKHLPSDITLYVKEHTSMLGRRPLSFYTEINKIYNVKMIAPSVSTFDLIRKARATVTVTGTAGWEAFLLGRPVIALGDVFYNALPGVLHTALDNDTAARIKSYLKNFRDDLSVRRNAFRAYYTTLLGATQGDINVNATVDTAADNAKKYAHAMRLFLQKWGFTMDGAFPEEIAPDESNKVVRVSSMH